MTDRYKVVTVEPATGETVESRETSYEVACIVKRKLELDKPDYHHEVVKVEEADE